MPHDVQADVNDYPSQVRTATAVAAALALTLAACGGDDDASGVAVDDTAAATTAAPEPADGATITISNFAFAGVSEVAVGTTVIVTNTDGSPHTWTAADGSFDSGALGEGESFEFTFTEPGELAYSCNFHPSMTGTITVTG